MGLGIAFIYFLCYIQVIAELLLFECYKNWVAKMLGGLEMLE
jgi:hypothetical protein